MIKSNIEIISENLLSIHPLLYKSIAKPMRRNSNVTPGGMFVMGMLKRFGMLSMSDIGKHLSMPKPHVTVIVDKLIDERYVERQNDPNDRRIINIVLTEKGKEDFEAMKQAISENLKEKLSLLNEEEQERLSTASQSVKDILVSILTKECKSSKE
jgi:DNA-binding MarR family transcriptional regulator